MALQSDPPAEGDESSSWVPYPPPRLGRQLVHLAIADVREQTAMGRAPWGLDKCDSLMAFVTLPHCMQTSSKFWSGVGFTIGDTVDRVAQNQATLQKKEHLKPCGVEAWKLTNQLGGR